MAAGAARSIPNIAIVMAGGGGTRLWPASTPRRPKQLLQLSQRAPSTLLAAAVERARQVAAPEHVFVVTSRELAADVLAATPELLPGNVIVEPRPRSTAPCVALALLHVRQALRDAGWSEAQLERAVVTVLPADHHVPELAAFTTLLRAAGAYAGASGRIVTLGVLPRRASTGYGYIERGPEPLAHDGAAAVYPALRFIEKPDAARAQAFVDSQHFLWNAGIFVMPLGRIFAELERHAPQLCQALAPVGRALAAGQDPWPATLAAYEAITAVAIDIAVMEKQTDLCVIPMAVSWTDLGSWASLHEAMPRDAADNVVIGPRPDGVQLVDTRGSLVWSEDVAVAVVGLTGIAVVVSGGKVLVCPLDRAEEVRRLAERDA